MRTGMAGLKRQSCGITVHHAVTFRSRSVMGVAVPPASGQAGERHLSLNERFRPEFSAEPWYERLSAPGEMTILHDEAQSVYRAFFSARRKIGRDPERRGCIGSAISPDLRTWSTEPPIFAPNLFSDMVAPRIFSDGGRHQ